MSLHRLASVIIGVPNVNETRSYYEEFGLTPDSDGWFRTTDGGRQLQVTGAPTRRLIELGVDVDDEEDLDRVAHNLHRLDIEFERTAHALTSVDLTTGVTATLQVAPRRTQPTVPATAYNGPGRIDRTGRAPGILRTDRVHPRKLGHAVVGTTNLAASTRFFVEGLGFRASDFIKDKGAFLRCSNDHHNLLVLESPVTYLHHTSWQVDDIDDIGRGAQRMLEDHPERHVWGLGRHHAGSNFFWYLKDPAGNFSEYFSDMDCIVEDQLWTPEVLEGAKGLFNWGPPPPPSFINPDDLAGLMAGTHSMTQ